MENKIQILNDSKRKFLLGGATLFVLATVFSLSYLGSVFSDETPPTFETGDAGLQGFIATSDYIKFDEEDFERTSDYDEPVERDSGVQYFYSAEKMTMNEIVESIAPDDGLKCIAVKYGPEAKVFYTYPKGKFKNSAEIADLDKFTVEPYYGFILICNNDFATWDIFGANEAPEEVDIDLDSLQKGWNLIAFTNPKDFRVLLNDCENRVSDNIFMQDDSNSFEKIDIDDLYQYESAGFNLAWVKMAGDKDTCEVGDEICDDGDLTEDEDEICKDGFWEVNTDIAESKCKSDEIVVDGKCTKKPEIKDCEEGQVDQVKKLICVDNKWETIPCVDGEVNSAGVCVTNTRDTQSPSDVLGLSGTSLDRSVRLRWNTATDNVLVKGYKVYYGLSPVTLASETYDTSLDAGNVTEFTVTGLTNDQTYYFSVKAYDAVGNMSRLWATEIPLIPKAPVNNQPTATDLKIDVDRVLSSYTIANNKLTFEIYFKDSPDVTFVPGVTATIKEKLVSSLKLSDYLKTSVLEVGKLNYTLDKNVENVLDKNINTLDLQVLPLNIQKMDTSRVAPSILALVINSESMSYSSTAKKLTIVFPAQNLKSGKTYSLKIPKTAFKSTDGQILQLSADVLWDVTITLP